MYLPEGKVMPAYSTWQPADGKTPPTAQHRARVPTRRLVAPRGDPMRGDPIASTLLGVFDGPSGPFLKGGLTAVGESWFDPAQPNATKISSGSAVRVIWRGPGLRGRTVRSSGCLLGY